MLLKGPDQVSSLISVLFKFRERKVAISADIQEMFHQIIIRAEDQSAQRFLWRHDGEDEVTEYVMKVMTFGSCSSPCTAQYVKNRNAREFAEQYPRAAKAIIENHYVDDLLDSVDTIDEAIQLAKDIHMVHKSAGFNIRGWISNAPEVLHALGVPVSHDKEFNTSQDQVTERVLGLRWDTKSDSLCYSLLRNKRIEHMLTESYRPTKREVLRFTMMIFDPLGLLANFIIYAKVLLQQMWIAKIDWDEKIPDELFVKWQRWIAQLKMIDNISFPRCYLSNSRFNDDVNIDLHIFVDASRDAYAATAYWRVESESVECALICAKSKVAPLKIVSIPRLELEGALLGVRMANNIIQFHTVKPKRRFFWSDSKTVLSWIKSDTRRYRQYVAFRVDEILEHTNTKEWRYVPSSLNIADEATKWAKNPEFHTNTRWYHGPEFLYQRESEWPTNEKIQTTTEEALHVQLHHGEDANDFVVQFDNFSSWNRLRSRMMYILRFIINIFAGICDTPKRYEPFTSDEFRQAEFAVYRQVQTEVYAKEIATIKNQTYSSKKSLAPLNTIADLNPYLDENDVLRSMGRIQNAKDVGEYNKRPIILPTRHHITDLIIQSYHQKFYHQNHETVTNELRQMFSIPKIRTAVKRVVSQCQVCKNKKAKPTYPMMSNLPAARLQSFTRPFSHIGIDYFGPMLVSAGRKNEKRWGVIITCLTTRAIHLEVANSLSTDSCILCLRNFMARRGVPVEIYSDQGTNFKGASRELDDAIKIIDHTRMAKEFTSPNTSWIFNPPSAPHMGGSWERLVQSVKKTLAAINVSQNLPDEVFRSYIIEVENTINSRPLTYLPLDSAEQEALTPNHLLIGSSNGIKPLSNYRDESAVLRRNWEHSQRMANVFWKRWVAEYLPTLSRRGKWMTPTRPLEVGDLVIIVDDQNPRNCWPKGRIIKIAPGSDGQVRKATVQTQHGVYDRPAVKLALLDVMEGKSARETAIPGGGVSRDSIPSGKSAH